MTDLARGRAEEMDCDELPPMAERPIVKTAPATIYLQVGNEDYLWGEDFDKCAGDEVTWCGDSVVTVEVEYTRADVAAERTARLEEALREIADTYDMRSELFTNDADCAANLADRARLATPTVGGISPALAAAKLIAKKHGELLTIVQEGLRNAINALDYADNCCMLAGVANDDAPRMRLIAELAAARRALAGEK